MGRPRKPEWSHLPAGVHFNRGWVFYQDPATAKWTKLGREWDAAAREKWVKLSTGKTGDGTVGQLLDACLAHRLQLVREKKLAARTYEDNCEYTVHLKLAFGAMRYLDVTGRHCTGYLEKRSWQPPDRIGDDGLKYTPDPERSPERANKEISFLSSAFKWGMKSPDFPDISSNPVTGVERNPKARSERCPEYWEIECAKLKATPMWALIFDLAYICGKRGAEIRLLPKKAVQADGLHVAGVKNSPEVIIEWSPDLIDIVLRIFAWSEAIEARRKIASPYLILARDGGPYGAQGWKTMSYKIIRAAVKDPGNKLQEHFTFHNIRAASATDEEDLYGTSPQARLGHKRRATTDIYIRSRRPKKVKALPIRKAS